MSLLRILSPVSFVLVFLVTLCASMNPAPELNFTISDMKTIKAGANTIAELKNRDPNLYHAFLGTKTSPFIIHAAMTASPKVFSLANGYLVTLTNSGDATNRSVTITSAHTKPDSCATLTVKPGSKASTGSKVTALAKGSSTEISFDFPNLDSKVLIHQKSPFTVVNLPAGTSELYLDKWYIYLRKSPTDEITALFVKYVPNQFVQYFTLAFPGVTYVLLVCLWSSIVILVVKKFDHEMYELGGGWRGAFSGGDAGAADNADMTDLLNNGELPDGDLDGLENPDNGGRPRSDKRSLPSGRDAASALDDDLNDTGSDADSDEVTQKTDAHTFAFIASTLFALALLI